MVNEWEEGNKRELKDEILAKERESETIEKRWKKKEKGEEGSWELNYKLKLHLGKLYCRGL